MMVRQEMRLGCRDFFYCINFEQAAALTKQKPEWIMQDSFQFLPCRYNFFCMLLVFWPLEYLPDDTLLIN
jgi:hypothetical protein